MYIFALAVNIYSNPMNTDHEATIQRKCSYLLGLCKRNVIPQTSFSLEVHCLEITFKLKLE